MRRIVHVFALLFLAFALVACEDDSGNGDTPTDQELIDEVKSDLTLSGDLDAITSDVTLPEEVNDVAITWTSDQPDVISDTGAVTRPEEGDVTVTLTASFTIGDIVDEKEFVLTVLQEEVIEQDHSIDLQFDDPEDADIFNLGDIEDMHEVEDGNLVIEHTGETDYPSKGARLEISTDKYPYLIFFVDELEGDNPMWAAKVHINGSEEDYSLVSDTSSVGLVHADLRDIEPMPVSDEVTIELYIYILGGEGHSVSFDYIVSSENVPGERTFDDPDELDYSEGAVALENERIEFDSEGEPASFDFTLYTDSELAPMLDLFVLSMDEGTEWSLLAGDTVLIDQANRIGAHSVDLSMLDEPIVGMTTYTVEYDGVIVFDSIANQSYRVLDETFEYADIDALLEVWTERGSARLDLGLGADDTVRFSQALPDDETRISRFVTTNYSAYPELEIDIAELSEDTVIDVKIGGTTVATDLSTTGTHSINLIDFYLRDLSTARLELTLRYVGSEEFDLDDLNYADINSIQFKKNDGMSEDALPPKGDRVVAEGGVQEYGFNDNNWTGNARVIARDGQLLIINTDWYSKAEVFAQNIDLNEDPFINVEVADISADTTWTLELIINPGAEDTSFKLLNETSATGLLTFDLREYIDAETIDTLSYNIFVIGGADKIVTIDHIEQTDTGTGLRIGEGDDFDDIDGWTPQDNMTIEAADGVGTITLESGEFGKVTRTFLVDVSETPYLYLDVRSTTGRWKIDPDNLIAETGDTGEFYVDLSGLGSGITSVTLDFFVIGEDGTTLEIDALEFVETDPNSEEPEVPEIFDGFTPALDIESEYADEQFVVTLNSGGYGKVSKEFTVDLAETPYLYVDVASLDGNWKVDPLLLAETSDTGEFYIDLSSLGSGEVKFELDIFVIGGDGTQLVIDDMEFVEEEA
ncbi:MAG: immunoglobulin-like domain-containing protein [Acholeplasmataceae bacterium]